MSTVTDIQTAAERRANGWCEICGAEPTRRFAITVDGEELRVAPLLCPKHGDSFLLRVGHALGSLLLGSVLVLLVACGGSSSADLSATPSQVSGAGGATKAPEPGTVRTEAGSSADPGGEPAALAGAGGLSAGSPPTPTGGAGGMLNVSGTGGSDDHGGAAGSRTAHGGEGGTTCLPRSWDAACAGRSCGSVPDSCGGELHCGSCSGLTECTDVGQCATTCHALGLECGEHPAFGLSCGSCPDGQQCGSVSVGHCSTCAESPSGGVCPAAYPHLWTACGAAPAATCRKPYNQDPSWWCCP